MDSSCSRFSLSINTEHCPSETAHCKINANKIHYASIMLDFVVVIVVM